ncbi:MAG: YeeE/YedE thiosulfate transporter family protein [Pirellulaceae bacterium]
MWRIIAMIGGLSMFTFYFTFYFSNKPLGASTAYARVAGLVGYLFARRHTDSLHHYAQKKMPKIDWEVMLVGGIVLGAFLAAWTGGEVMARWLPPRWVARFGESVWLRLGLAFLGGGLMAFGARIASVPAVTASAARWGSRSVPGSACHVEVVRDGPDFRPRLPVTAHQYP